MAGTCFRGHVATRPTVLTCHEIPRGGCRSHGGRGRRLSVLYTALDMPATRTQIYLTAEQRRRLDVRRKRDHRTLAELIRDAVDAYLAEEPDPQVVLIETFGSLPDLAVPSRDEWERG